MKKTVKKIPVPERLTVRLLCAELALICLSALGLLFRFLTDFEVDPVGAGNYYEGTVEYIMTSLVIAVGGAALTDLVSKQKRS